MAAKGKSVVDAGGVVIEILEANTGGPVSKADLDAWINAYRLPVTSVMDPEGTGTPSFDALGQRETTYIVDLRTMTIVERIVGDVTGFATPGIDTGIAHVLSLLAAKP